MWDELAASIFRVVQEEKVAWKKLLHYRYRERAG
jgi:hypothetical protein